MKKINKNHVKVGDRVKVISGSQKGFIGNITSIFKMKSQVIIDGITPRVKFTKSKEKGEAKRVEIPLTIHVSNVMLWDKDSNTASKIGYKFLNNQKKRYFKKSGNFV